MQTCFLIPLLAALLIAMGGCSRSDSTPVAEGVILYVSFQYPDGSIHGLSRFNDQRTVPGGNGSWNIDARGKLTHDFLLITRPQRPDLGAQVIPVHRLLEVQFGDGGIKTVNEGQPNPAK